MYVIWPWLDIIYHYRSIIVSGGYQQTSHFNSLLDIPIFLGGAQWAKGSARPCTEVKQEMCSVSDAMREYTKERRSGMTDWWWIATYIYIYMYYIYNIHTYIYIYIHMYIYILYFDMVWYVLLVILFHKGVVTVQEEVLSDDEKWKCEKCKVPASRGRSLSNLVSFSICNPKTLFFSLGCCWITLR